MTRGTPWGHEKPERRYRRAQSHFCREVGSTMYVSKLACPYCREDDR